MVVSKGFVRDEVLQIRLREPVRRLILLKALKTAKLHQTMDKHKTVPVKDQNNQYNNIKGNLLTLGFLLLETES